MIIDYHVLALVAALVLTDILSGLAQAVANKSLSSRVMRDGMYHKLGYAFMIAACVLIEWGTAYIDMGFTVPLSYPCCAYIGITEALSIVENAARLNPQLRENPVFKTLASTQNRRKDDQ